MDNIAQQLTSCWQLILSLLQQGEWKRSLGCHWIQSSRILLCNWRKCQSAKKVKPPSISHCEVCKSAIARTFCMPCESAIFFLNVAFQLCLIVPRSQSRKSTSLPIRRNPDSWQMASKMEVVDSQHVSRSSQAFSGSNKSAPKFSKITIFSFFENKLPWVFEMMRKMTFSDEVPSLSVMKSFL